MNILDILHYASNCCKFIAPLHYTQMGTAAVACLLQIYQEYYMDDIKLEIILSLASHDCTCGFYSFWSFLVPSIYWCACIVVLVNLALMQSNEI